MLPDCSRETGGGVAERTLHLSRALVARGAVCTVLTLDIGIDEARRQDWSHVRLVALPCLSERFFVPAAGPRTFASIVAEHDVIDLASHWTLLNAFAYRAARAARVPYFVHPAGALGIVGRSKALKRTYNLVVGRRIVRDAAGHIAVTAAEADAYSTYGIQPYQLTVVPNGVELPPEHPVDPGAFRVRHDLADRRIILYVGRLAAIKGPDLLLNAFADVVSTVGNYALVFAGPDLGMLDSLRRIAEERGVSDSVRFTGHLGGPEKEAAFQACDFLALPSRREAMSLVALEAGARAKPVLLTDQCGFDEAALIGGGVLVPATVAGLRDGLRTMISRQEELPAMGRALQALVRQRYTWEAAAGHFLALCERTVPASRAV